MQPYPRSPDLIWPGHLHGTGCLSARAVGTGFPTVVRRLCLGPGCGWVWVLLTPPVLAGVLGGCVWARFVVLSLFCRLFVVFVVGLRFRPAYGTCVVACALRLPPAVSGSGVRCGRACWARVSAVPCLSWLGCRGVFFALFFLCLGLALWCWLLGVPVPGLVAPVPPSPFFQAGLLALFFFSWCVSACFGVPFPGGPLVLAWCCRFWLGGPPVPLWGSCLRCLLGGGFGRLLWCWRAVWWLWAVFAPPPPPPVFLLGGGAACSSLCLPWAGTRTGPHSAWSSGLLLAVAFCLAVFRPNGSDGLCTFGLGAPSCQVRSWLCRLGGCARRVWLWVRGLGLLVSFPLGGAGFNLLCGPPPLLPGARWPRVWCAVLVCGVLVRRLPGCAVACFG